MALKESELTVETLSNGLEFVPRTTWQAEAPTDRKPLKTLVKCVRMTTTTGIPSCDTLARCCKRLKKYQLDQMNKEELEDIAYNFMVAEDGRVYEGRGWKTQGNFSHYEGYLAKQGILVAYVGKFNEKNPVPEEMEATADRFVKVSIEEGKIHPQYVKLDYLEKYDGFPIVLDKPEAK